MLAVIRAHRRIRPRGLVALTVALSAAFTVAAAPSAPANELGDRQRRVHHQIGQAEEELRQSSQALLQATTRVRQAQDRLDAAQSVLRTRRAQLAAAELLDAETQSELDDATARLQRAKTALAQGRRSQDAQQQQLRRAAAETYQSGSPQLLGLTMVLTSHDPTQLSSQLNVVQNVMDRESATLQRLEASRLLLQLQERHVQQARDEVAARRRAAAAALARTQTLEVRAAVANDRVSQLLAERTKAQAQAARAKRADEQRLNQLVRERDRIESLILRQEAEMRRRESRAAIMRAKRRSYYPGSGLTYPVQAPITSPYGMRLHPVYHRWTLHDGTDFGAACGTPIHAAAPGRVIARYYNIGYGNRVIIAHGYIHGVSVTTGYNHLSRYASYVGEWVRRGQVIGYVGTTGFSTGCHLHFMVFVNGHTVNPMTWLP